MTKTRVEQQVMKNHFKAEVETKYLDPDFPVPESPIVRSLPLTAESTGKGQVFLMDCGWKLLLFISVHAPQEFFRDVLGKKTVKNKSIFNI